MNKCYIYITECIMCVQGHDSITFSFLSSFLIFDWVGILWPQLSKVLKPVRWAGSVTITTRHSHLAQIIAHSYTEHSASSTAPWSARGSVTSLILSQSCTTSTQRQRHLAATNSKEQSKRHTDNSKEQKSGRQHERLRELPESHCNRSKRAATV